MKNIKRRVALLVIVLLLISCQPAYAAVKRVRKSRSSGVANQATYQGVRALVRLRPDRLGLTLQFSNFDNLESGRYELLYTANAVPQGAGGSIIIGDTSVKQLLFATCSAGVCNYHRNITNCRLSVTSKLKNGTTVLKPFLIRL